MSETTTIIQPINHAVPEVENWSQNGPLTDLALAGIIEASNAYAFAEFHDPINDIYMGMISAALCYLPQLLTEVREARSLKPALSSSP